MMTADAPSSRPSAAPDATWSSDQQWLSLSADSIQLQLDLADDLLKLAHFGRIAPINPAQHRLI
ncbi:hypothetical protein [Cobetia sp. MC34]|uniref:hypothetical protein n=1 Tax=Cobetia sp. MC34 TaxID=2785080 RepID=UPI001BC9D460|nr:hypothetical protein [Cobetia sp. MC34]MBS4154525.1 hypothetical protein [Cobetia sp. MC34]